MIRRNFLVFVTIFTTYFAIAQDCNCSENFTWLKKTFEKNDAGYQYVIDQKGIEAYNKHSEIYLKKSRQTTNVNECADLMKKWSRFFRAGHLSIRVKQPQRNSTSKTKKNSNSNWESRKINLKKFKKYINKKEKADFEGIWNLDGYKIGIKKENENFVGFIIESTNKNWKKNFVKLSINKQNNLKYRADYYMGDFSKTTFNKVELVGNNVLKLGNFYLNRVNSPYKNNEDVDRFIRLISTSKPVIERINATTLVLRIPTFNSSARKAINELLSKHKEEILKTENLIIDIRNNGGGSDSSYSQIVPFIYTNPIKTIGVEYLSTELNNQRMLDFINIDRYNFTEEGKKWAKRSYDKLKTKIGEFVNLKKSNYSIKTLDTVHAYPKNVGIIINKNNGSTAEQFLLAAKQSKKVKLFGTTTYGVLDISNMYFVDFPSDKFTLGYSLTRSLRIPDMTIDNRGIQPDYYIDSSVPEYHWIKFVNETLNNK